MADMWEWVRSYRSHQDVERRELPTLYYRAYPSMESDPKRALVLLEKGRQLAEALNEPCWMLFFDFWRCELYIFYLRDLKPGRDLAMRLLVEASKPVHVGCPVLSRVYTTVLSVFNYLDPIGYADRIQEMQAYLEKFDEQKTQFSRVMSKAIYAHATGDTDSEIRYLHECLALSNGDAFQDTHFHMCLCHTHYYRSEFEKAYEHAIAGEVCAQRSNRQQEIATMLAWQAVFARRDRDEEKACNLYRQAVSLMSSLGSQPIIDYPAARANFHEVGGEFDEALKVRQEELEQMLIFGSPHYEVETRLKICRLLGRMGRPFDEELAASRKSAEKLLNPVRFNQKVERILNGDYSDRLD